MDAELDYDPERAPDPDEWLAMSEWDRMAMVHAWHRANEPSLSESALHGHAAIHVILENQLAMNAPPAATEAFARLRAEGLPRHEALHAMGSVLAELMHGLVASGGATENPSAAYAEALKSLTKESWLASGR